MNALNRNLIACLMVLAGAACTGTPPPSQIALAGGKPCQTAEAAIFFDFEGAPPSVCTVDGDRAFTITIAPEHAPPINPSPWYAFRYEASGDAPVAVRLEYIGVKHRYIPKLSDGSALHELAVELDESRRNAAFTVPAGTGLVSAQPLLGLQYYADQVASLSSMEGAKRVRLGNSIDGHPIDAAHFGDRNAPELIVLLGRQHPPEVTGAYAFEPFAEQLFAQVASDPAMAARFQILAVPLLNPDGVVRGNWRANMGAIDLNRDWGKFTQPETAAVKSWLEDLPASVKPVLMIDFHSTQNNLFYVQGDEADETQQAFLTSWLGGKESRFADYPFTLERRNANPGSGTAKNWFYETYNIPSYTYEVGDQADEAAARSAARQLARDLAEVLKR